MSLSKNEVMNELYNAGLVTLGAVATSMVSKKLAKDDLGVTNSTQRILNDNDETLLLRRRPSEEERYW